MSAPTERPILFGAPMVRAILEGRKTQTRRIVKAKHLPFIENLVGRFLDGKWNQRPLPYGQPGDRLWVRETWQGPLYDRDDIPDDIFVPACCEYRADGGQRPEWVDADGDFRQGWRPSIHMPRWASRLTLEITDVRVERLNDISEADASAEGAAFHNGFGVGHSGWRHDFGDVHADARSSFARLWNDINGRDAWLSNPWVWAISFIKVPTP